MKENKIDKTVEIIIKWNNRKLKGNEAMSKIFDIHKKYVLSEINPKRDVVGFKDCKFCGRVLPINRISYCNKTCMNNVPKNNPPPPPQRENENIS